MYYNVLCENNILKVKLNVCYIQEGTVETKDIPFSHDFIFKAKHITICKYNEAVNANKYRNFVLIYLKKLVNDEKTLYKMILYCEEKDAYEKNLYVDDCPWRMINENTNNKPYSMTITLEPEIIHGIKPSMLYEDEQLTDFKLKGQDGEIYIHKAFLAASSKFFKSQLINLEKSVDSQDIPKTTVNTLRDFKRCIYTEVLPDDNLLELLLVASYFKISWLEYQCINKLMKDESTGNVLKLLEFALEHKHIPLLLGIAGHLQDGGIKVSEIRKHYLHN